MRGMTCSRDRWILSREPYTLENIENRQVPPPWIPTVRILTCLCTRFSHHWFPRSNSLVRKESLFLEWRCFKWSFFLVANVVRAERRRTASFWTGTEGQGVASLDATRHFSWFLFQEFARNDQFLVEKSLGVNMHITCNCHFLRSTGTGQ